MFYMTMGIQASGKTTKAKEIAEQHNAIVHSYDDIVDFDDIKGTNKRWIDGMRKDLLDGKSVVCDSTNLTVPSRKWILKQLDVPCKKTLVVMIVPVEECLKRNASRDAKVDEKIIKEAPKHIEPPSLDEGWDEVLVFREEIHETIH